MSKTEGIPHDDLAVMVWAELEKVGREGLSTWEMRRLLPLTTSQIRAGITRINQVLQQSREQPLITRHMRGRSIVYYLPEHCSDYRAFAIRRLRELITRAETEMTRAESAVLRWPDDLAPYVPKMLRRAIEDIGDLLTELVEPGGMDERQARTEGA